MANFRKYALIGVLVSILLPGPGQSQTPSPTSSPAASQSQTQTPKTAGIGQASSAELKSQSSNGQSPKSQSSNGQSQTTESPSRQSQTGQPPAGQPPADSSAFALLDSVFRRPEILYVAVGPDIPADLQPILVRLNNAIAANQAWFEHYRNSYPNQPLPYDEHFGISIEQYARILRLQSTPPALVPIDSQTVAVIKEGNLIHLQCSGSGEEHLLNYLYFDPAHRVLEYGGDTIPFAGPANAGRNSPYGQWKGYAWRLERIQPLAPPVGPLQLADPQKAPDPKLTSARIVEVNIGIPTDGSPKTFIRIQYQNVQAGIATGNMELLGYIE